MSPFVKKLIITAVGSLASFYATKLAAKLLDDKTVVDIKDLK
jgi:hypothetical protein